MNLERVHHHRWREKSPPMNRSCPLEKSGTQEGLRKGARRNLDVERIHAYNMEWLPTDWIPRVVIVDIDGTLTDDQKVMSTKAMLALRRLEDLGIPVVLATGNVRPVTYGLWRFIGLSGPMCCENGGVLWHPDWEAPIIRAKGRRAHTAALWLSDRISLDANGIETNAWRESEWCLKPNEDEELIRTLLAESDFRDLSVVRTGFAIHIMDACIDKGQGLEDLFERMGWSLSDALAVGDAPNDLSMFDRVGWSVAVGGAFPEVTQAADVSSPYPHGQTFEPLVDAIVAQINRG